MKEPVPNLNTPDRTALPSGRGHRREPFSRLIRSLEDRSILVLLDNRITTKRYGQTFLASLPPYRITQTITDVEAFFQP